MVTTERTHSETADLPGYLSVEGRPIEVHVFGDGPQTILLMAGVHGDETRGVDIVRSILEMLQSVSSPISHEPSAISHSLRLVILPLVNPDAYAAGTRRNARGIDINRNLPTKDFGSGEDFPGGTEPASEPETRAVLDVVQRFDPCLIISLHESLACVNYNGDLAAPIAERMSGICGLPVKEDIGYPCPGSMGTYFGWERQLPVITLELAKPEDSDLDTIKTAVLREIGVGEDG